MWYWLDRMQGECVVLFAWDITVAANTLASNPSTQTLKLTRGVITKVDVKFPAGCHGLVSIRLLHEESALVPLNKDTWLTGDDETVPISEYFEFDTAPYSLKFVGKSPGTSYDHTITVRVTILPKEVATMLPLIEVLTRFLQRIGVLP